MMNAQLSGTSFQGALQGIINPQGPELAIPGIDVQLL